jgi:hypothetical protein
MTHSILNSRPYCSGASWSTWTPAVAWTRWGSRRRRTSAVQPVSEMDQVIYFRGLCNDDTNL